MNLSSAKKSFRILGRKGVMLMAKETKISWAEATLFKPDSYGARLDGREWKEMPDLHRTGV